MIPKIPRPVTPGVDILECTCGAIGLFLRTGYNANGCFLYLKEHDSNVECYGNWHQIDYWTQFHDKYKIVLRRKK